MGSDASVVVTGNGSDPARAATLAERGIERLGQLERRWTRFDTASEVARLNRSAGTAQVVSAETVQLVEMSVRAWYATGGAFDPTLLGALLALGYTASRDDPTARAAPASDADRRGRPDAILVDASASVVQLPPGTTIDPGGIGKGLAADIVAGELLDEGAAGVVVDVGGDLLVAGAPPDGEAWVIALDACRDRSDGRRLRLMAGGVATSTVQLRTWTHDGVERHHLVDPRTGAPCRSDAVACTVVAGSAAWAEAFTKVPFTRGVDAGLALLDEHSLAASITTVDGVHRDTKTWRAFCP